MLTAIDLIHVLTTTSSTWCGIYIYDSGGYVWARSTQELTETTCTECLDEIDLTDLLYEEQQGFE